mmetsp:Transcript_17202/g.29864  ORF Transcript_17202/g.29864 Transcript_17202/m.29864 type:complete len:970 (+) Transcript_17202:20-2929(+)
MIFSLLLICLPFILAHNWINTNSRSPLQSEVSPCRPSSNGGRPHVKVAPGQRFQIEWSTGHGGTEHYFIYVKASDFNKLTRHNDLNLLEDYVKNGPQEQQKEMTPIYKKYHRTLKNGVFDLVGETFQGSKGKDIKNYIGRQMIRGEDPMYIIRPSNMNGCMLKPTGINNYKNCYYGQDKVDPDWVYQYENNNNNRCLENDRRIMYKNPKYPWIIGIQRYHSCFHDAFNGDVSFFSFPENSDLGRYVVHYRWRGFYDCIDVELVKEPTEYPYGTDFGRFPPHKSKFAHLKYPARPGDAPTAPPTPVPTPVPPTPAPVIPQIVKKLVAWYQCDNNGGGDALATPAKPAGKLTGYGRISRNVKFLYSQVLPNDWVAVGAGVSHALGGERPLDHALRITVAGGNPVDGYVKSPAIDVVGGQDHTVDFWYYMTVGDQMLASIELNGERTVIKGNRDGPPSGFTLSPNPLNARVPQSKFLTSGRYFTRIVFTPKTSGKLYLGFGPGSLDQDMYLCAVGVAQNAGDGDAFLHRRQNINKASGGPVTYIEQVSAAVPKKYSDVNGAGSFDLKADGRIMFENAPAIRSQKTFVSFSDDSYLELDFIEPYVPTASDNKNVLKDNSGYGRNGEYLKSKSGLAESTLKTGCVRSEQGGALANLGKFDLYDTTVTLSLWFKLNADGASGGLLSKGSVWSVELSTANKLAASVSTGGGVVKLEASKQLAKDVYHHVALTYDGKNVKLYLAGAEVASKAATGALKADPSVDVLLGNNLNADIADIRVYQDVVSVQDLFTQKGRMPGGARSRDQFARIDHCLHLPETQFTMVGKCKLLENAANVDECLAECAAMSVDACDAVDVYRLVHEAPVYKAFRNELNLPDDASCKFSSPPKDSFACFAVKHFDAETFSTVSDIEDPAFYGSCYLRVPLSGDKTPEPLGSVAVDRVFRDSCLSCDDAKTFSKHEHLPNWTALDARCEESCD